MPLTTVFSVLERAAQQFGKAAALHQPIAGTKPTQHQVYSWIEYRDAVIEIACGLRQIGVQPGEIVALYSETRAEFYLADQGVMALGAVAAALYTANPLEENLRALKASGAKVCLVEDPKTKRMFDEALRTDPSPLKWILLTGEDPRAMNLEGLRQLGREALKLDKDLFKRVHGDVDPRAPGLLYLTSGATGEPKMGLVTQHAVVSNLEMGPSVLPLSNKDRTIAFLPSAHIAQRVVVELLPILYGMPVWFSESLMRLPQEMQHVKPTMLLAPPRVWERIHTSVLTEVKKKGGPTEKLFWGALGLGLKASELRRQGKSIPAWVSAPLAMADRVIFAKVRARLGGKLQFPISGSAPLGKDLALFFEAIGMPLIEGYGLTEGGVTHMNPVDGIRPGTIGKALPGIEHKLAEDGELLLKSSTLFSGYFNDPAATALVLRDGWLYTGDIADIDADGYVSITGRKKELLVSSNGKKIYPARIESLFKGEPLISQVVLVGDRLPYVTALITLNPTAAEGVAEPEAELKKAVARVNAKLASFEQIRKFKVLEGDFSVHSGELTPTMKVRRGKVLERYKELVASMYQGKEESH
jgi:long-chain acyl-CoA synthetase